jgi:hypothetical protein
MKRMMMWAGCLLAAAAGAPASASPSDEGTAPAGDAATAQTRFYLYGLDFTRAGERFTFLGAYDTAKDAHAAGKLVCENFSRHPAGIGEDKDAHAAGKLVSEGELRTYYECRVEEGVELVLPPSKAAYETRSIRVYRLSDHDHAGRLVGRYSTMREAATAAEKVLADGDSFQVMYWWD